MSKTDNSTQQSRPNEGRPTTPEDYFNYDPHHTEDDIDPEEFEIVTVKLMKSYKIKSFVTQSGKVILRAMPADDIKKD